MTSHTRDHILQQAKALREDQRCGEALALLDGLAAQDPSFSRLYQERAACHIARREAQAAIAALEEALRLNPTLPACWDMLAQLYRLGGDEARAKGAADYLALLMQLPREVVVANSLYADGDLEPAEEVLRDYLAQDASNHGARRLLARICMDREAAPEAEAILSALLQDAPDYHDARLDYAIALLAQQKHLAARQQAEALLKVDPDNREYLKQYGAACVGLGDHEPVIDLFARLLAAPDLPPAEVADLRLWRANALKVTGRQAEAIEDYRAALAARPNYGVAWFSLANLKTYRFTAADITAMREAEAQPDLAEMDRIYLCFALGKALEDREKYALSWQCYERGNALRRRSSAYDPAATELCAQRIRQALPAQFFEQRQGWGHPDPAPIFILGLPRSGSTLIEQILASHAQVEGTQELTEITRFAQELCGSDMGNPQALDHLTADQARALGQRFLAETATYRRLGRAFFIDKMPNNFWHIGLIHLMLPKAKIIDIRREPMACCFSNLKQLFGTQNQEFTYGIEPMARHYRAYLDLMRHWDEALPSRVLRVHYEDVVEDLEGQLRAILAHCGLPFDPACLAFHQTRRPIRTPSSEQVRQPIGRAGLARWRHYEPWLGALRDALGDAHTQYKA